MISVMSDNKKVPVNRVDFSDGAFTYKLNELPENPRYILIRVDPCTHVKDIREEIDMVCSCIENFYGELLPELPVKLILPYLPYARADRVFEKGNPSP